MRNILVGLAIVLIFLVLRYAICNVENTGNHKQEGYADQVMHGVAGGIAGPILDPSLYDYDAPQYPLYSKLLSDVREPKVLWSMPPEPPA